MSQQSRARPIRPERLAEIAADFQRSMNNLDKCPDCGRPRTTVSVSFGNAPWTQVTSDRCTCPEKRG